MSREDVEPPEGPLGWGHPNGNHPSYGAGESYSCGCLLAILIFSIIAAAVITGIIMHATHTLVNWNGIRESVSMPHASLQTAGERWPRGLEKIKTRWHLAGAPTIGHLRQVITLEV